MAKVPAFKALHGSRAQKVDPRHRPINVDLANSGQFRDHREWALCIQVIFK